MAQRTGFRKAYSEAPSRDERAAAERLDYAFSSRYALAMRIEYHRTLLADRVRNAAFHEALCRVVVKGKTTVADIGAGTGFLGFLAAKLGAKRVDFYERADIADVARKLLRHNRLTNCRIAEIHSTDVATPDRVDVVVSETLGNYPFEENIVETLNDARARFLNPGGIVIPRAVEQFVCPVTAERFLSELSTWDDVGFGLDFAPAKTMTLNNIYVRQFEPGDLLRDGAAAQSWDKLAFDRPNKTTRSGDANWPIKKRTTVYGLALWWSAELVDGVSRSAVPRGGLGLVVGGRYRRGHRVPGLPGGQAGRQARRFLRAGRHR